MFNNIIKNITVFFVVAVNTEAAPVSCSQAKNRYPPRGAATRMAHSKFVFDPIMTCRCLLTVDSSSRIDSENS